jgi:uncharacterized protein
MLLGLLADTHILDVEEALSHELKEVFHDVDLILHAGDIYIPSVLDELECIAPVLAAQGDDDGDLAHDRRVKDKHVIHLGGKTIWLIHERAYFLSSPQSPWWHGEFDPELNIVKYNRPDIVVFGHEHRTVVQNIDNVLFVNPGSPTFLNYVNGPGTVGILDLDSGNIEARIVHLNGYTD